MRDLHRHSRQDRLHEIPEGTELVDNVVLIMAANLYHRVRIPVWQTTYTTNFSSHLAGDTIPNDR